MKTSPPPPFSPQELRRALHYTASTGIFYRTATGKRAGGHMPSGYVLITGQWPSQGMYVDHINGDSGDNRWHNLRLATGVQNARNTRLRRENKLGVRGVRQRWDGAYRGSFQACITKHGRQIHLGTFSTVEAASAAYQKAARKLFGAFVRDSLFEGHAQ